jgi:hypothetical protein
MSKKRMLICLWGKRKQASFLQLNPFLPDDTYKTVPFKIETDVNINTVIDNYKNMFTDVQSDVLWSTWAGEKIDDLIEDVQYIITNNEPEDWETFLNKIQFPHHTQIRNHPVYHTTRPGVYTRLFHVNQIDRFIKENKINYDVIVLARTDVLFKIADEEEINFDEDVCYIPEIYWGSRGETFVNDHVIFGKFDYVLDKIKSHTTEEMKDDDFLYEALYHAWNPEQLQKKIITKNNGNIKEVKCKTYYRFPIPMQ